MKPVPSALSPVTRTTARAWSSVSLPAGGGAVAGLGEAGVGPLLVGHSRPHLGDPLGLLVLGVLGVVGLLVRGIPIEAIIHRIVKATGAPIIVRRILRGRRGRKGGVDLEVVHSALGNVECAAKRARARDHGAVGRND